MGVDPRLADLLGLRHGDVWVVKTVKKTKVAEWYGESETLTTTFYKTLVVKPPEDWPEAEYGFWRSHLRYGDISALTDDEIMTNFKRLLYEKAPDRKYFSRNATKNRGMQLVWVRRVTTL